MNMIHTCWVWYTYYVAAKKFSHAVNEFWKENVIVKLRINDYCLFVLAWWWTKCCISRLGPIWADWLNTPIEQCLCHVILNVQLVQFITYGPHVHRLFGSWVWPAVWLLCAKQLSLSCSCHTVSILCHLCDIFLVSLCEINLLWTWAGETHLLMRKGCLIADDLYLPDFETSYSVYTIILCEIQNVIRPNDAALKWMALLFKPHPSISVLLIFPQD